MPHVLQNLDDLMQVALARIQYEAVKASFAARKEHGE